MLFISSDYVFDGKEPPFGTESPMNPSTIYGQLKRDSEEAVMSASKGKKRSLL